MEIPASYSVPCYIKIWWYFQFCLMPASVSKSLIPNFLNAILTDEWSLKSNSIQYTQKMKLQQFFVEFDTVSTKLKHGLFLVHSFNLCDKVKCKIDIIFSSSFFFILYEVTWTLHQITFSTLLYTVTSLLSLKIM